MATARTTHNCFWPACPQRVPRSRLGCRPHWYRLPRSLRDRIWAHYQPGQDIATASPEYLEALQDVVDWAARQAGA